MTRERPAASDPLPPADANPECTGEGDLAGLTRAEERALRRSAPLTPAQFKALRRRAERGLNPRHEPDEPGADL